jgi:hypothetical protein
LQIVERVLKGGGSGLASVDGAGGASQQSLLAYQTTIGEASVFPGGGMTISQPLNLDLSSAMSPTSGAALVYDANSIDTRPIIQLQVQTSSGSGVPSDIKLDLTFNGVNEGTVTFSTTVAVVGIHAVKGVRNRFR